MYTGYILHSTKLWIHSERFLCQMGVFFAGNWKFRLWASTFGPLFRKTTRGTLVNWPFFLPENAFASKCLKRGLFNSIRNGFLLVHYHRKSLRRMPETQLHTRKIDFWARKVVKKCLFRGIFGHIWQNGLLECYRVSNIMTNRPRVMKFPQVSISNGY